MRTEVKQLQLDEISTAIIEEEEGEYWYSVEGTHNGLLSQSEDIGPFKTLAEAEADAAEYLGRLTEEDPAAEFNPDYD